MSQQSTNKITKSEYDTLIAKSLEKSSAKIFLSMSMAAVWLSTNLKDIKSMGFKPFIVGFVSLLTVGLVSILSIKFLSNLIS